MPKHPSEQEVAAKLKARGVPEHVLRGGSAGLLNGWRKFVSEVEQGYPMGLDEYRNDLDLRELISVAGLDSEVENEDQRFRDALTAQDRQIWESGHEAAFWVRGYPRNASGILLDDLRAEGLLVENEGLLGKNQEPARHD